MSESPFPTLKPGEEPAGRENKTNGLIYLTRAPSGDIVPMPEFPAMPYAKVMDDLKNTRLNKDDVLLSTYPKTGEREGRVG